MSKKVRINKFFTEQGVCSRREADRLIEMGRVTINGRVAVNGDRVGGGDRILLDGKAVPHALAETKDVSPGRAIAKQVYLMYNKPKGIVCTTDTREPHNIIDAIRYPSRIFHIGRLDKESTGLILLTNDGDIVNRILRAQYGHEKEYRVEVDKPLTNEFLKKMASGVDIGGIGGTGGGPTGDRGVTAHSAAFSGTTETYITKPCTVKKVGKNTFTIVLTEGKNRQIRRMCAALGFFVRRLHRFRIMNIEIGDLENGCWREIPERQLEEMKSQIDSKHLTALKTADKSGESADEKSADEKFAQRTPGKSAKGATEKGVQNAPLKGVQNAPLRGVQNASDNRVEDFDLEKMEE